MNYKRLVVKKRDKDDTYKIDEDRLVSIDGRCNIDDERGSPLVQKRYGGSFKDKGLYLNDHDYDWVIGMDNEGMLVLVPLRKRY